MQRTVLKVEIDCVKCKKKLLKAVSGVHGVDKIEIDEAKGTLTVTGNADPYEVIVRSRKTGKRVEVVSIGPPPPKQQETGAGQPKKPDDKKSAAGDAGGGGGGDVKKTTSGGDQRKGGGGNGGEEKKAAEQKGEKGMMQSWPLVNHQHHHDPLNCPYCQRIVVVPMTSSSYDRYYHDHNNPSCYIM